MRVFKTKGFARWADSEGVLNAALLNAVREMSQGLINANLGGHVSKSEWVSTDEANEADYERYWRFERMSEHFLFSDLPRPSGPT